MIVLISNNELAFSLWKQRSYKQKIRSLTELKHFDIYFSELLFRI